MKCPRCKEGELVYYSRCVHWHIVEVAIADDGQSFCAEDFVYPRLDYEGDDGIETTPSYWL